MSKRTALSVHGQTSYPMCVDCGQQQADAQSFAQGEPWPARCGSCWDLRRDPAWARQCFDEGYKIPVAIYDDLRDIDADDFDSREYVDEGLCSDGQAVWYEEPPDGQFEDGQLLPIDQQWMAEVPPDVITPDIEQLVEEAFSPFEDRRRSFWEWLNAVDLRGQQMARKLRSAHDAHTLIQERQSIVDELTTLFTSTSRLRRQQLEAALAELALKEQIMDKLLLAKSRLRTQQLLESQRQQKLLPAPAEPVPPTVSHYDQVVNEHREELEARAAAQRAALADFRSAVADIMADDIDDGQKAHELRALLESYRIPETALPQRVREFLADRDAKDEP